MKKTTLYGGLAGLLILSACSKESYYKPATYLDKAVNVITSLDDNTTQVSTAVYAFDLTFSDKGNYGIISVSDLTIDTEKYNFVTQQQNFSSDGFYELFTNVTSPTVSLSNSSFLLTPYFNNPQVVGAEGSANSPNIVVAQYTLNNKYLIKTFHNNTVFTGITNTSYIDRATGEEQKMETNGIKYLLELNVPDDSGKANLSMIDAKFSNNPNERPKEKIVVPGLDVVFSNEGIVATGENIVPTMVEGGEGTPVPAFIINEIEFKTTNPELTDCEITFIVANYQYNGAFTGKYTEVVK
ncbi:MAG: hypothetical protein J1F16_04710 [Muribaculaceae bacterium]|nr:hypothetical protein [Muribaculaceae bacterium]